MILVGKNKFRAFAAVIAVVLAVVYYQEPKYTYTPRVDI